MGLMVRKAGAGRITVTLGRGEAISVLVVVFVGPWGWLNHPQELWG
jgi:hypothetical protein